MREPAYHILFLEDSSLIRQKVLALLQESKLAPFQIHESGSLAEGLETFQAHRIDAVLLDLGLPDSSGLETLKAIQNAVPHVAVVILTGDDSDATVMEAMKVGAQDYLLKEEVSGPLLHRTLRYAIERKRLEEELRHKANVDELTGLFSRRHLMDTLDRTYDEAVREDRNLSLCICDLDDLKRINDTFGHRKGDEILAAFGAQIRDALGKKDFAGRYGGDEFVLGFPDTLLEHAAERVRRIRETLAGTAFLEAGEVAVSVTATFGIAGGGKGT
ncbi:MAG: GGDEF domain-containing protein [Planctomycetota bacterium]|jgi:diguanylate cyclase (GGDEF)-like protein